MSVQSKSVTPKQQNRMNRLSTSYTEGVNDTDFIKPKNPRDVYLYRFLDKDLLRQTPSTNASTNTRSKTSLTNELLQRYKQSMAPSRPAYRSILTIEEALNPPWALNFYIKRQPATPNFVSNSTDALVRKQPPRRLVSAPLARSPSPPPALTIPEPRLVTVSNQVTTTNSPTLRSRSSSAFGHHEKTHSTDRSSSALGHYETTHASDGKKRRRKLKPVQLSTMENYMKLSIENIHQIPEQINEEQTEQPVQIIFTEAQPSSIPPPPVYIYKKSATWCPDESSLAPLRQSVEGNVSPANPHYVHRPGVISVENVEKRTLKTTSPIKKTRKHRHTQDKQDEPILTLAPMQPKTKIYVETEGIKLTYDPKLTLDDKSPNLSKYLIDGRLYLIKDHRYNVLNNVDSATIQKYNQNLLISPRPKYYQTVPIDKYQLPKPSQDVHYNASETYFYNTIPKRPTRYVIHPNFISENLNVNRVALGQRPPTTTIYA
ncbi:unnamed protein product [Adineta steineri]|uniref:Uncharacterized protein n=1 Tax=Adineta steineri TaxID=433720 RepID=A0A815DVZ2_9BILA|nr:unnamed protein product [Adineta steineri]CAF1302825.1 unnamed protein product [Adineta steineri]CAF1515455.1 unnamed protein product [Adineta steineri]CAF1571668.1 unnamed protein product [Adineta steineri]CAF1571982.1 unnamed protein product [Adineta steineri]